MHRWNKALDSEAQVFLSGEKPKRSLRSLKIQELRLLKMR
jgi:hypothetical protein